MGGVIRRDGYGNPNGVLEEPRHANPCSAISPLPRKPTGWKASLNRLRRVYGEGRDHGAGRLHATGDWGALRKAHELWPLRNRVQILPGVSRMDINTFNTHASGTQPPPTARSASARRSTSRTAPSATPATWSNPYHKIIYDSPDGPMWRGYPMEPNSSSSKRSWGRLSPSTQRRRRHPDDNAYEEQKRYPRADARHIVIHCQTVREDQLDRIKRLGVVPSFFVVHTYFWGDRHETARPR